MDEYEDYAEGNGTGDEGYIPPRPTRSHTQHWGTGYRMVGEQ